MVRLGKILTSSLLFGAFIAQASDIFIADLAVSKQAIELSNISNITNRQGYDNQPHFDSKSEGLYYTAMYGSGDSAQTDSIYYSLASGLHRNITKTENSSEYSPTPINNDTELSMIFVDESGSQKLWRTDIASGKQRPINLEIEPVGYHAWGKDNDLLLFVLGDEMMLQYATSAQQSKAQLITTNIGRSLRYHNKGDFFTFSKGNEQQTLHKFEPATKAVTALIALPKQSQYYTWLNADTVISASGSKIYFWHYHSDKPAKNWQAFADVSAHCATSVSRLAVAPDQKKLAFVCEDK